MNQLPRYKLKWMSVVGCWLLLAGVGCGQEKQTETMHYTSPEGYDLNNPEVFGMADELEEVSGIAFADHIRDTLFAQQDEEGKLFFFAPGQEKPKEVRFGKDGDYEDIALLGHDVIMLRSDGSLFRFPVGERNGKRIESVEKWKTPFPEGEYESLATGEDGMLYILCKECKVDRKGEGTTGYGFRLTADGDVKQELRYSVSHEQIERYVSLDGKAFRPSAMTWNRDTNEWYVISSINKMLVILDSQWQVKEVHRLDPDRYIQPEGLAFDQSRTLYIASERGKKGKRATVYKIRFNNN